ncbi:MAG: molybdopterin oxidoreductase family protein [Limisphaerales bacterium]
MKSTSLKKNTPWRRWEGPLTAHLTLRPGDFGLGKVPARLAPDATTTAVCGYCSTGCGLKLHLRDGRAVNLTPAPEYPVNLGMACPKGWEALTPLCAHDRATTPLLGDARGEPAPVSWDTAMRAFCGRFKAILEKHGPGSVAWLGTGQICTEELAFLGAFAKFGMGVLHGDGNTRQCMATAVTAYKQSFGFDAPPYTYADLEQSDVLVFVGSNLCVAHPILWQRVLRNRGNPEIIVIDPRATETAVCATRHLAIRPKSDLQLFYGVANLLITNGWIDREFVARHTTDFDGFAQFVRDFTLEQTSVATGLSEAGIRRLAETIHRGKAVSFWWTMGVNQGHESTRTAQAIINLALMTGNIGRPGTGANSITGQCNAMGSRLFSNTTNLFGGRDFPNPAHRAQVADILGIPVERIPAQNSWAYDQIVQGIADGAVKGLWIVGTNGSHSWINQNAFNRVADQLDFLVVQDMYHTTETARRAHLVLPAAGWGEKDGTFINSERRIGLVKKISSAPGQALSDFNIVTLAAHYWGCGPMFREWSSPEAVFQILKRLTRDQPCDISGIRDYRMLEECGGVQWPYRAADACAAPGIERRLFEDRRFFHADGKARFRFEAPRPAPEPPDAEYPFLLLTGRGTSAQWHTQTRTAKSDVLRALYPGNLYVEINPRDARRLRIVPHQKVEISSRRDRIVASAHVTATVQSGQVFLPMHYEATNRLTQAAFDPYSRQPSYKACAVRIQPVRAGRGTRLPSPALGRVES